MIFCWCREGHWLKMQDTEPDPDTLVRSADPDPYQNVTDPEHWLAAPPRSSVVCRRMIYFWSDLSGIASGADPHWLGLVKKTMKSDRGRTL